METIHRSQERDAAAARGYQGQLAAPRSWKELKAQLGQDYGTGGAWLELAKSTFTYLFPVIVIGAVGSSFGGRLFRNAARPIRNFTPLIFDELFSAFFWTGCFRSQRTDESYGEASARDVATGIITRLFLMKGGRGPVARFILMPTLMAFGGWFAEATVEKNKNYRQMVSDGWSWELAYRFVGAFVMMNGQSNLLHHLSLHADDWRFFRMGAVKLSLPVFGAGDSGRAPARTERVSTGGRSLRQDPPLRRPQFAFMPAFTILPTLERAFLHLQELARRPTPAEEIRRRWVEAFLQIPKIECAQEAVEVIHHLLRSGLPRDDQMGGLIRAILRRFPLDLATASLIDPDLLPQVERWDSEQRTIRKNRSDRPHFDFEIPRDPIGLLDGMLESPANPGATVDFCLALIRDDDNLRDSFERAHGDIVTFRVDNDDKSYDPELDPFIKMREALFEPRRLERLIEISGDPGKIVEDLLACDLTDLTHFAALEQMIKNHPDAVIRVLQNLPDHPYTDEELRLLCEHLREYFIPVPEDPPEIILRKMEMAPLVLVTLNESSVQADEMINPFLKRLRGSIRYLTPQLLPCFANVDRTYDPLREAVGPSFIRFSENLVRARQEMWNRYEHHEARFEKKYGEFLRSLEESFLILAEYAVPPVFHLSIGNWDSTQYLPVLRWMLKTDSLLSQRNARRFWKMLCLFDAHDRGGIEGRLAEYNSRESFRSFYVALAMSNLEPASLPFFAEALSTVSPKRDRRLFSRWQQLMLDFGGAPQVARQTISGFRPEKAAGLEEKIDRLEQAFRQQLVDRFEEAVGFAPPELEAFRADLDRHQEAWWRNDFMKHLALTSQFADARGIEAIGRLTRQLLDARVEKERFVTNQFDYLRPVFGDDFIDRLSQQRRFDIFEISPRVDQRPLEAKRCSLCGQAYRDFEEIFLGYGQRGTPEEIVREIDDVFENEFIEPVGQDRIRDQLKEIVCDLQRGVLTQKNRLQEIVDYFERDLKPMHPHLDPLFMEDLIPTLRQLMRDQESVLRFSDGTRPKGHVEVSPDPTLKFIWGNEVWKNCLRTDQQTDMNASGTIPNHAFLGQFLTVRLVLTENGEKVEAKMLLEVAGTRNKPALIGRGLYGYGYRVTEWLQEGVRLYGEWLGIPNERIFLPDGRFTAGTPRPPLIPPQNHFPGTFAILRE